MTSIALLLRITITAVYLGLAMRALGKRGWHAIRPLDLILAFVLGNLGAGVIIGRIDVYMGVSALGALLLLHLCAGTLLRYSAPLRQVLWGAPALLIHDGKISRRALAHAGVTEEEVFAMMRAEGVARLADVQALRLESDGNIVLIRAEGQRPLSVRELQIPSATKIENEEEPLWRRAA